MEKKKPGRPWKVPDGHRVGFTLTQKELRQVDKMVAANQGSSRASLLRDIVVTSLSARDGDACKSLRAENAMLKKRMAKITAMIDSVL